MIVAASGTDVRRTLVELTEDAQFGVRAVAADPTTLAKLLRPDRDAWVVTGGTLSRARPFLSAARTANAAVVAMSGPTAWLASGGVFSQMAFSMSVSRIEGMTKGPIPVSSL